MIGHSCEAAFTGIGWMYVNCSDCNTVNSCGGWFTASFFHDCSLSESLIATRLFELDLIWLHLLCKRTFILHLLARPAVKSSHWPKSQIIYVRTWKNIFKIFYAPSTAVQRNFIKNENSALIWLHMHSAARISCLLNWNTNLFFSTVGFRHISYDLHSLLPFTGIDMTSWWRTQINHFF